MLQSIYTNIENRIATSSPGTIFLTRDFIDLASNTTIRQNLGRLTNAGKLRRVMQGVYEKPAYSDLLQQYLPTDPDAVAHAIADAYHWNIAASGDLALNQMGLSTQIPVVWSYISDGPYRVFQWDNIKIEFKHRTNRDISGMSSYTSMVIESIRALGKERVNDEIITKLRNTIPQNRKSMILEEAKSTSNWIYEIIRKVCVDK